MKSLLMLVISCALTASAWVVHPNSTISKPPPTINSLSKAGVVTISKSPLQWIRSSIIVPDTTIPKYGNKTNHYGYVFSMDLSNTISCGINHTAIPGQPPSNVPFVKVGNMVESLYTTNKSKPLTVKAGDMIQMQMFILPVGTSKNVTWWFENINDNAKYSVQHTFTNEQLNKSNLSVASWTMSVTPGWTLPKFDCFEVNLMGAMSKEVNGTENEPDFLERDIRKGQGIDVHWNSLDAPAVNFCYNPAANKTVHRS